MNTAATTPQAMGGKEPAPIAVPLRLADKYFTDIIPEPFCILGLRLKPLSLGRYRLMKRFSIAYVADEAAQASFGDLILGVLICSMTCDDFKTFANSKQFESQIKKWSQEINARPPRLLRWASSGNPLKKHFGTIISNSFYGRWWRKNFSFDVLEKIALFKRYISEGSVAPQVWDETTDNRVGASHWSQCVEVVLRGELGWSQREIDEEPLNKALWDYYKHLENQGLCRILSAEEAAELARELTPAEIEESRVAMEKLQEFLKAKNAAREEVLNGQ